MRKLFVTAALLSAAAATPAFAQDMDSAEPTNQFRGFYVGGSIGTTFSPDNDDERILFDRDLNGSFGDTVTTAAGANAFSPGFCGGSVGTSPTFPVEGCDEGGFEIEFAGRIGFDIQTGPLVVGIVGEVGTSDYRASTTAISITPASYTFTREIDYVADVRARIGTTVTPMSLVYLTAGLSMAKLETSFVTTNTVNGVDRSRLDDEATGSVVGLGFEQKLGQNLSFGVEYLYREFEDESVVRLTNNGSTPATNPFLLGNPNGTDFTRSQQEFDMHSLRAVVNFRF